ncbi:Phox-associated domain [Striga asiatica]|uniref:Phox-associated domain n=1 Tax=Striga asiatica TaxID=4170 RepID=A0A5A7QVZ0_STRAF|nr:Phox-associated domain [Striga asiatica]
MPTPFLLDEAPVNQSLTPVSSTPFAFCPFHLVSWTNRNLTMFFEEKRSQVVSAMLKGLKNRDDKGTTDEISSVSARPNAKRRGINLGPVEIISGASVGPAKMFGAARSRQILGRPEMATPVQSWRKSCYWKLQGIYEAKAGTGKGFSSVSPKPRNIRVKFEFKNSRQATTTILSRKALKKADYDNDLNSGQIPSVRNRSLLESDDERDERLKHRLMASKELHPALISPECEYKVLQWLIGGLLAVVLKPREVQCPLVRRLARELLIMRDHSTNACNCTHKPQALADG